MILTPMTFWAPTESNRYRFCDTDRSKDKLFMYFRVKEPRRVFRVLLFAFIGALVGGCGTGAYYRVGVGAGYPGPYYRYGYYPYSYYGFGAYPYQYWRPYGYDDRHFYRFDRYRRPHTWDRRPYRFDKPFRYREKTPHRFNDRFRHWERRPYGSGVPFRHPRPEFRYRR